MPDSNLFENLKNRKIVQWGIAYLAGAWLLLQLAGLLGEAYGWPPLVMRALPIILALGLVVTLIIAWYHGEKGEQRATMAELIMIAGILLIAGVAVAFLRKQKHQNAADVASVAAPSAEQGSIAVLPFVNMSGDQKQTYFSDGLTEELLNVLAQIPELRVAARTSSFSFRDSKAAIDSIGRALHVEYVVEGSVRSAADRVRITAQLIKASTGFHVWSGTYDRDLKDIFAVQDEISRAIVSALRVKLARADTTSLADAGTSDLVAHDLVLKGAYALAQRNEPALRSAEKLLKEAIARDPKYARAHATLANTYWYIAYRRYGPVAEYYNKAEASARQALELDSGSALAEVVLGRVADVHHWKFAEAERHFARAIELNLGLADAYSLRAWLQMRLGKPDEAIATAKRGVELDPVSQGAQNALASMFAYADRPAEAEDAYKKALELSPGSPVILDNLALSQVHTDPPAALRNALQSYHTDSTDVFAMGTLGYVYARAGQRAEAEKILAQLARTPDPASYLMGAIHAALGRTDEAFKFLDRALAEHDDFMPDLGVDDIYDSVRGDPRMAVLLKKIGLP